MAGKITFALAFGNRGFMPGELILNARDEMVKLYKHKIINVLGSDGKAK